MASAATGYKLSLGADGPPGSYQDFGKAEVFFVIGSNMADCPPVLFLRMMGRVRSAGAKLIVVDPQRTATADKADLFLQIKPGTGLALLNGLRSAAPAAGRSHSPGSPTPWAAGRWATWGRGCPGSVPSSSTPTGHSSRTLGTGRPLSGPGRRFVVAKLVASEVRTDRGQPGSLCALGQHAVECL
jgi:hypothetical protein